MKFRQHRPPALALPLDSDFGSATPKDGQVHGYYHWQSIQRYHNDRGRLSKRTDARLRRQGEYYNQHYIIPKNHY